MSEPFLSSDEYDERAHQLYNDGKYDEAIETLREGLELYAHAVELHVGLGYARLARDEFAWARRAFEEAVALDADHEDALAGLGEVLLKFGDRSGALACFDRILALGLRDDQELMLQIGRALFREGILDQARRFFEVASTAHPESAEAAACSAAWAIVRAAASPSGPVHAFATRAFIATARIRPGRSESRSASYTTGAARTAFLVNTPAVAQLVVDTSNATSTAPSALSPAGAAAAVKPRADVTDPSGTGSSEARPGAGACVIGRQDSPRGSLV